MVRFILKDILQKQNKTRYWLAKETGLDFSTINNIMNNKVKQVHLVTIYKICMALNCDISDIMILDK